MSRQGQPVGCFARGLEIVIHHDIVADWLLKLGVTNRVDHRHRAFLSPSW
jgi:hypothetical protein